MEMTFPFNPITMNGCTDSPSVISYEIEELTNDLVPEYFKISIDSSNSQIRFTAFSGGSEPGPFTFRVTGTLPGGTTTETFEF